MMDNVEFHKQPTGAVHRTEGQKGERPLQARPSPSGFPASARRPACLDHTPPAWEA